MAFNLSSLLKGTKIVKPTGKGVVGIDIGSSSIKIVQLHKEGGRPTLDTYGELQLGPYGGTEIGRIARPQSDKLTEALVDILREAGATTNAASVAISFSSCFTAIITVPEIDPEKITAIVPVEAKKFIPVPLIDVRVDWYPIQTIEESKSTKMLLIAVHNEALSRYETVLKGANAVSVAQEIEPFSAVRTVLREGDGTVAIIDIGAGSTKLYIAERGVVAKAHSISMTALALTEAVAKTKRLSFLASEELKRSQGLGAVRNAPELEKAFVQVLERGYREIMTIIQRYETDAQVSISKVVLTGGGALLGGLVQYTQDVLARPVELANPFAKVNYPAFLEDMLKEAGPSFAVALGVALRGLDQS